MSEPAVSVLLPTDADVAVTLRCLQALARLPEEPDFEVVVVVPEGDVANRGLLEGLEGDVRVVVDDGATPQDAGPGDAFDRAAAAAGAPVLVALSAGAVPADGWLADLLGALDGDGGGAAAALPRSLTVEGVDLPEASWLALAVRSEAYNSIGGFGATRTLGRAEKATLLGALRAGGHAVAQARAAVLLAPDLMPDRPRLCVSIPVPRAARRDPRPGREPARLSRRRHAGRAAHLAGDGPGPGRRAAAAARGRVRQPGVAADAVGRHRAPARVEPRLRL